MANLFVLTYGTQTHTHARTHTHTYIYIHSYMHHIVSITHIHPHSKTTYTILPMHEYRRYRRKFLHRCVTYSVHYIINHITTLVLMPPTDLQIPCQCSYTICIFLLSLSIHFCTMLNQYMNVCVYLLMNTITTLCRLRNQ